MGIRRKFAPLGAHLRNPYASGETVYESSAPETFEAQLPKGCYLAVFTGGGGGGAPLYSGYAGGGGGASGGTISLEFTLTAPAAVTCVTGNGGTGKSGIAGGKGDKGEDSVLLIEGLGEWIAAGGNGAHNNAAGAANNNTVPETTGVEIIDSTNGNKGTNGSPTAQGTGGASTNDNGRGRGGNGNAAGIAAAQVGCFNLAYINRR